MCVHAYVKKREREKERGERGRDENQMHLLVRGSACKFCMTMCCLCSEGRFPDVWVGSQ